MSLTALPTRTEALYVYCASPILIQLVLSAPMHTLTCLTAIASKVHRWFKVMKENAGYFLYELPLSVTSDMTNKGIE